jgi:cytochrome c oxidase assembly factor CtaG
MLDRLLPLGLLAGAFAYAVGIRRLWAAADTVRLVGTAQATAFAAAIVTLLVALVSPLEDAATRDLPVHMVQHLLILAVAAPLLAVSEPVAVMTRAVPAQARRRITPVLRRLTRSQTSGRGWLVWTTVAFALSTSALWLWHVPTLYDAAVDDPWVHALEHLTFLATATLFWWMVLGAGRRTRRGLGVLAVFAATLPATALGILMTMAQTPWYGPYAAGGDALRDQQVAGALMWGFGGSALVVAAAALFASWLAGLDRAEQARPHQRAVERW